MKKTVYRRYEKEVTFKHYDLVREVVHTYTTKGPYASAKDCEKLAIDLMRAMFKEEGIMGSVGLKERIQKLLKRGKDYRYNGEKALYARYNLSLEYTLESKMYLVEERIGTCETEPRYVLRPIEEFNGTTLTPQQALDEIRAYLDDIRTEELENENCYIDDNLLNAIDRLQTLIDEAK